MRVRLHFTLIAVLLASSSAVGQTEADDPWDIIAPTEPIAAELPSTQTPPSATNTAAPVQAAPEPAARPVYRDAETRGGVETKPSAAKADS
ncbi:MAG: hypothetical protein KDA32_12270, partial [Phycisphaerales bacterium]|nr:hypothetical protein [Phycisphaerales bacterium]